MTPYACATAAFCDVYKRLAQAASTASELKTTLADLAELRAAHSSLEGSLEKQTAQTAQRQQARRAGCRTCLLISRVTSNVLYPAPDAPMGDNLCIVLHPGSWQLASCQLLLSLSRG